MGYLELAIALACLCCCSNLGGAFKFSGERTPVDYFVGDWTSGGNLTQWSQGKVFYVGDALTFTLSGTDLLVEVDENAYESCKWSFPRNVVPSPSNKTSSWNFTLPLVMAGDHYYISTVEEQCKAGFKLMVDVLLAPAPPVYMPKAYTVGDDQGWALGVDFSQWIAGKKFYFGDAFVFKFNASQHSLVETGQQGFQSCNSSYILPTPFVPRHDPAEDVNVTIVPFLGQHYYVSSVADDCKQGLKVSLDIRSPYDAASDAPSPSPDAAAGPGAIADQESGSVLLSTTLSLHIVAYILFLLF